MVEDISLIRVDMLRRGISKSVATRFGFLEKIVPNEMGLGLFLGAATLASPVEAILSNAYPDGLEWVEGNPLIWYHF